MAITLIKVGSNKLFKSADDLEKRSNQSKKIAGNIGKSLKSQSVFKRQSIVKRSNIYQKRKDGIRRKNQKDLFEASRSTGSIRTIGKVVSNSNKGFLGRILDAIALTMVGWAVINLPTIISLSKQLGDRMSKMTGVLSSFMTNTFSILQEIGTLSSVFIRSLASFDFNDMGKQVDSSLDRVQNTFNRMELDIANAIRLLLEPYDFEEEQQQEPPPGAPTPPGGPPSGLSESSEMYRIAAALSTEGSGPQSTVDMMQVVVNRKASGRYGATYTDILSAGTGGKNVAFAGVWKRPGGPRAFRKIRTLEDAAKWSGQSKATLLKIIENIQNPTLQANAAKFVGGAFDFRASPQNNENGRLPGTAWRGGAGDNQFLVDPSRGDPIRKEGPAAFNLPAPQAQQAPVQPGALGSRPLQKGDVLTQSIGRGVSLITISDVYGSRGGKHGGIDITAPAGTYIALRVDCEWVGYANDRNGYGHVLDVWAPDLGVQLRFAHLRDKPNSFTKLKAGTSFAQVGSTGRSTGPHIHFEYTKNRGQTMGGSDGDPSPYVPYLLLTNNPNNASFSTPGKGAKPAQISGRKVGATISDGITPEKGGKTLVVAAPPQVYQTPAMMVGSAGDSGIVVAGPSLNSLIKQRVLMELAYT